MKQFRIARGRLRRRPGSAWCSFEFQRDGEDAGHSPCRPGTIEADRAHRPGVRWDSGFVAGDVIGGNFDSMAKFSQPPAHHEQAFWQCSAVPWLS